MQSIQYVNSQNSILTASYEYNSKYKIKSISGLTTTGITSITSNGYMQNGSNWVNNKLGARVITITIFVECGTMAEAYEERRRLANIFNPLKPEGKLIYINDYISKAIDVVVTGGIEVKKTYGTCFETDVDLTAYNPFFYDLSETMVKMNDFIGGMKYGFKLPFKLAKRGDYARINNTGDIETPIRCVFTGYALNPVLQNETTGESIKVTIEVKEGQELIINTAYGNKTVELKAADGTITDYFNAIDINSDFFGLALGMNKLSFKADFGTPTVFVYYRNLYSGV